MLRLAEGDAGGVEAYRTAEAAVLGANIRLLVPGNRVLVARRAMALGLMDDAHEIAGGVEPMMRETGEKSWLAEYHRLCASFALHEKNHCKAESELKTAIDVARRVGGTLWELRSAIDLAGLYKETGRVPEAISAIQPMLNSIEEGDCPIEVKAAGELMAELGNA
jgi:hypothetical protein